LGEWRRRQFLAGLAGFGPADLAVWTAAYEASASTWLGSAMALQDRAANLLAWIETEQLFEKPLLFIAHSLGGLVVKQALRMAADRPGQLLGRVLDATQGVAFLATPNTGSELATWLVRLRGLLAHVSLLRV
jgi:predicted alpha/beta hydrolase family esterase